MKQLLIANFVITGITLLLVVVIAIKLVLDHKKKVKQKQITTILEIIFPESEIIEHIEVLKEQFN